MNSLPELVSGRDVRWGRDPFLDAWLLHFKTENNIEHLLNAEKVASDEQLRFMVALADDEVFVPCADDTFKELLGAGSSSTLMKEYCRIWRYVIRLIRQFGFDTYNKKRVIQFCRHRFRLSLASNSMLPSRLEKRLVSIVLTQCSREDPYRQRKQQDNKRAYEFFQKPTAQRLLQVCPSTALTCRDIKELRWELDFVELKRLLYLSTLEMLWKDTSPSELEVEKVLEEPCGDCGCLRLIFGPEDEDRKKVLYMPDTSGGIVYDMMIVRALLRMGHQVVLAVKEGFFHATPTIWDVDNDSVLKELIREAHVLYDDAVSKNDLLRMLREHRLLVISDGTREQLNLYKTSVTFARAWKECDVVLAKGGRNYRHLIDSSHEFTRDIICFYRSEAGPFHVSCKPRATSIRKFAEGHLKTKADEIIAAMREAKQQGETVIFYSAIIGSIPGQTATAINVVDTFVKDLRERLDQVFIINPAEHFESGMDGDDLMFMWERVQRSGLLDVWRFQTVEDIETSFTLMDKKVPSVWSGKDSTFSTGCTKEMHIALDMQKHHPELQIIGPSPDKFFRRAEYGVGKYYDVGIRMP